MPSSSEVSLCLLSLTVILIVMNMIVPVVGAASYRRASISCYKCTSRNKTHDSCHDPIHPANTSYMEHCKVPKENHVGLFPALYCVKVIGVSQRTGEEVVIRSCSLENMDNQCGDFKFEDEPFKGCILTCTYDGCNEATSRLILVPSSRRKHNSLMLLLMFLVTHITSSLVSAYGTLLLTPFIIIQI